MTDTGKDGADRIQVTEGLDPGEMGMRLNKLARQRRTGNKLLQHLLDFWMTMRSEHGHPQRSHFAAHDLVFVLPDLWMIDIGEPLQHRFRLVGTQLAMGFKADPTGMQVGDVRESWRCAPIVAALQAVLETRQPVGVHLATDRGTFSNWLFQGVGLPIFDPEQNIHIVLGAGQFSSMDDTLPNAPLVTHIIGISD